MSIHHNAGDHIDLKLHAAQRALRLVESGMTVGLGSGSTASLWINLLGEQVRDCGLSVRAIASSEDSERLGRSFGIPFVTFEECRTLDLTVDGADEIAPGLALIKGGGGKLLREKIVASASKRFVVVADETKEVNKLGRFPLPVEVIPMAGPLVSDSLRELGFIPSVRVDGDGKPYITDEGNLILDCSGLVIENPEAIAAKIDSIVGVVEHGLFLHMADLAFICGREPGNRAYSLVSEWNPDRSGSRAVQDDVHDSCYDWDARRRDAGLAVGRCRFHDWVHPHLRSAWYGKVQTTKSKSSASPVHLPDCLAATLRAYRKRWKPNPQGFFFVTRNNRPPSSNKVVQYGLWPVLDALKIPRCGLHAFRHTHASLLLHTDATPKVVQEQLRQADPRVTLGMYSHVIGEDRRNAVERVAALLRPTSEASSAQLHPN